MALSRPAYAMSSSSSSNNAGLAKVSNHDAALNALLNEVLEELAEMQEIKDMEGLRKLATVFSGSADEDGFIFNFEDVWRHAGYARKDVVKLSVVGDRNRGGNAGGLRRDIDVQISVKPTSPGHGGDRKTEQILLTRTGMIKFLVGSKSPIAQALACFFTKLGTQHCNCNALADEECNLPERCHASVKRSAREMLDDIAVLENNESLHNVVRDRLAEIHGGQTEAVLRSGCRVDVLCSDVVIEVKEAPLWRHAFGQAISYAFKTKKRGRVPCFPSRQKKRSSCAVPSALNSHGATPTNQPPSQSETWVFCNRN